MNKEPNAFCELGCSAAGDCFLNPVREPLNRLVNEQAQRVTYEQNDDTARRKRIASILALGDVVVDRCAVEVEKAAFDEIVS